MFKIRIYAKIYILIIKNAGLYQLKSMLNNQFVCSAVTLSITYPIGGKGIKFEMPKKYKELRVTSGIKLIWQHQ